MDRLMALRDALVALKGPLADDPRLREDLHERLFNEEANNRVLGKVSPPAPTVAGSISLGDAF
ncbi:MULTISPECIES: type VI secretion system contractile sheath small subunit [Pseudomonas]|nr:MULTISPECIES: type VI secretion system contractile sheath small subunit [Pseudomonas]